MTINPTAGHSSSQDEINLQRVLTDWIQAIEEFHSWYAQLDQLRR